jgi:hypothetical protein
MQKLYKGNNPSDMAKLLPGYYWMDGWNGKGPLIVAVYLHKGSRYISDGCEYTVSKLSEHLTHSADATKFYGPLDMPQEMK